MYSSRTFSYRSKTFRRYYHRFARYSKEGKLIGLSDKFKFNDVRIEFSAGLVISKDEEVIVSYGYKDVSSYLGKIDLQTVLEMIEDV